MGLWDTIKNVGSVALAPATGGLSLFGAGEDTLARIPVVGGLMGAQTDSQKALLKKQEQLAEEAKKRQRQNEQMRMQALGQSMLAFNPQNQMMAQMFGPQAAFSPQQMGEMARDPGARTREEFEAAQRQAMQPSQDHRMQGWTGDDMRRMEEDERRRARVAASMTPLGPGPAPLRLPTPQAGRKF
jgi:hypothetical protein